MERIPILDVSRIIAAQIVFLGHLRSFMFPDYKLVAADAPVWFKGVAFLSGFQGSAVIVFFVVSGWQVGGRFLRTDMSESDIRHYLIDRISRLWTVLVPVLVLSALLGAAGLLPGWVTLRPSAFAGNLIGLQTLLVPNYAGNSPLWSLSNEVCYYLMLPAIAALTSRRLAVVLLGAAVFAIYLTIGTTSLWLYSLIWFTGALFSFVSVQQRWFFYALISFLAALLAYRMLRWDGVFVAEWIWVILFCIVVASGRRLKLFDRQVVFLQRYTFSLYVLHVPLLMTLFEKLPAGIAHPGLFSGTQIALLCGLILVVNIASYVFYLAFERHYVKIRRWLKASTVNRTG
jgi:peptidoglycan/LPS O-acetylase OafA/YrhL